MDNQINFLSVLPPQIISSIASRLPIRSLINCKLVCKLWHSVFFYPFIAKSDDVQFLFHSRQVTDFAPKFAILDDDPNPNERLIDQKRQIIETKPFSLPPTFRYGNPEKLLHIDRHPLSSCNGLVCFSVKRKDLYLCNPVLGDFVSVPKPSIDSFYCDTYDLGFSSSSNQYKLIRFVCVEFAGKTPELEILTIGSPAGWRRHAGVVPSVIWDRSEPTICARGALHWLLLLQEKSERYILTFDLEEEEFGSIALPPIDDDKEVYRLGHMDHCLVATAGHSSSPLGLEIWARNDSVWTKNWVVDATESLNQKTLLTSVLINLIPRKASVDGRIFMTYLNERLYCYDLKDRLISDFVFSIQKGNEAGYGDIKSELSPWEGVIAYTAALISPQKLMSCQSSKKWDGKGTLGKRGKKRRLKTEKRETRKKLMQDGLSKKRHRKKKLKIEKTETSKKLVQDESSNKRDRKRRLKIEKTETSKKLMTDKSSKKRDRKRRLKAEKMEMSKELIEDESSKKRDKKRRLKSRDRKKRLKTEEKETA